MSSQGNPYIIQGGNSGSERLKLLANATWPTSLHFLTNSGISSEMRCLDLGCGSGDITIRLAEFLGPKSEVIGLDLDHTKIEIAKNETKNKNLNLTFTVSNIEDHLPPEKYDFIYMRFLLSHLKKPEELLKKARELLRDDGILIIEDVDFDGHFCYPNNLAFNQYVDLYKNAGIMKGADPLIGPKLLTMVRDTGYSNINFNVVLPTFDRGAGKQMALLTLKSIESSALDLSLITKSDFDKLLYELECFEKNALSIMSLPRIFQISVTK